MVAVEQLAHRAEGLDDLARRRAEAGDVERDQRAASAISRTSTAMRSSSGSSRSRLDAERAEDLVERVAVDVGVLAHVQAREMEAEDLDLADDVVQRVGGDEARLLGAQRVLGDAQVGASSSGGGSRRRRPCASRARARRAA